MALSFIYMVRTILGWLFRKLISNWLICKTELFLEIFQGKNMKVWVRTFGRKIEIIRHSLEYLGFSLLIVMYTWWEFSYLLLWNAFMSPRLTDSTSTQAYLFLIWNLSSFGIYYKILLEFRHFKWSLIILMLLYIIRYSVGSSL